MKSLSKGDAETEVREAARARSIEMDLMLPSGAQVVSEGLLNSPEMRDHLIVLHKLSHQLLIYWQFLVPRTKNALILPPPRAFFALPGRSFPHSICECGVPTH